MLTGLNVTLTNNMINLFIKISLHLEIPILSPCKTVNAYALFTLKTMTLNAAFFDRISLKTIVFQRCDAVFNFFERI